jgi:hypothetical protein
MTAPGPAVTLQVRDADKALEPYRVIRCRGCGSIRAVIEFARSVALFRMVLPGAWLRGG